MEEPSTQSGLKSTIDDTGKPQRLTFGRDRRLPDKAAYGRVFSRAKRSRDRAFTVLYCPNTTARPRLGLAVAKKNCRRAVARNRLKRIIRDSFRRHQSLLEGLDVVVMNNRGAELLSNRQLFDSLAAHWQRCSGAAQRGQD